MIAAMMNPPATVSVTVQTIFESRVVGGFGAASTAITQQSVTQVPPTMTITGD